jgi:hypothetical protein
MEIEVSIFLARFWGGLFLSLGLMTIGAGFMGRVIKMTDNPAITVSTGYITFLLGLFTISLHNIWVLDWRLAITLLGWTTFFKGITKIAFPDHINKQAQKFKSMTWLWGAIIGIFGAWMLWMSLLG